LLPRVSICPYSISFVRSERIACSCLLGGWLDGC
jgi:hypothetical protein